MSPEAQAAAAVARPAPERRTALAIAALLLCLAALPAWVLTLDSPALRSTGAAAWALLALGALLGWVAVRADKRKWVFVLAALDTGLFTAFIWLFFVFARLPAASEARSRESGPDFELESTSGEKVSLSAMLARGPVLLVFYRGPW